MVVRDVGWFWARSETVASARSRTHESRPTGDSDGRLALRSDSKAAAEAQASALWRLSAEAQASALRYIVERTLQRARSGHDTKCGQLFRLPLRDFNGVIAGTEWSQGEIHDHPSKRPWVPASRSPAPESSSASQCDRCRRAVAGSADEVGISRCTRSRRGNRGSAVSKMLRTGRRSSPPHDGSPSGSRLDRDSGRVAQPALAVHRPTKMDAHPVIPRSDASVFGDRESRTHCRGGSRRIVARPPHCRWRPRP